MKKDLLFLIAYIITGLIVVFSKMFNDDILVLISKNISLLVLLILFLKNAYRVNYCYISTIMLLMVSDSLLIFKFYYLDIMMSILLINKVIYTIIISNILKRYHFKKIIKYTIFYFFLTGPIFYQITSLLQYPTLLLSLFYIFISVLGGVSFVNLINKPNSKSSDYFIAMFLISISEAVIGISIFVEKSMLYMPVGYFITYIGRYYLYKSMIKNK